MTGAARKKVKASGLLLEEEFTKDCLSFATLTIPRLKKDELSLINQAWAEILNRFMQGVRRRLRRFDLDREYVYCTEVQEKRLEKYGEIALHLHLVFPGRRSRREGWAISTGELRDLWVEAIAPVVPSIRDEETVIVDLQRVKKSVANYLGKYLSKGASVTKQVLEAGRGDELPSEWWGSGSLTKKRLKARTIRVGQDLADLIWEMCMHGHSAEIPWCVPVMVDLGDGEPMHVGWSFRLSPEFLAELEATYARLPGCNGGQ
jgi:hypothetical protein